MARAMRFSAESAQPRVYGMLACEAFMRSFAVCRRVCCARSPSATVKEWQRGEADRAALRCVPGAVMSRPAASGCAAA